MSGPHSGSSNHVTVVHKGFNAIDADVTIQSSDGIQFKLHCKYLEAYSGILPRIVKERSASKVWIPTELEEPANVLEVLFLFVYPRSRPNLDEVDFETVMGVARATEKYEVFSAMQVCERRLSTFIEDHALAILEHGIQYKYSKLINEAALALSRLPSRDALQNVETVANAIAWIKYKDAWKATTLDRANVLLDREYSSDNFKQTSNRTLCYLAAYRWMMHLDSLTNYSQFLQELERQKQGFPLVETLKCLQSTTDLNPTLPHDCLIARVQECYTHGVESMPPFSDFLEGKEYVLTTKGGADNDSVENLED